MEKQITLSAFMDELAQAKTRKKEFLTQMDRIIPWTEWVALIKPCYYKGERGNKPYDLELMLRIHVLQKLYDLADEAVANEIIDSRAFSAFCGVDSSNQVPNGDTLGRFRGILVENKLEEKLFAQVCTLLSERGLILKKGTIVDSTLIAAAPSTHNREKQRDPEAHSTKKGNQWHFGYKVHIGVDRDTGLTHTIETTAANVHDVNMLSKLLTGKEEEVYGDSGYLGAEKHTDAIKANSSGQEISYKINRRPSQVKKFTGEAYEKERQIEHDKSSIRCKVEHVFGVVKRLFHFHKTRYRGLQKLNQHCQLLFALANLYLADKHGLLA